MRAFIAAELSEELLDALGESSARLRASVRGRYVRPDQFHVTLAFLGDIDSNRVPVLQDLLDEACSSIETSPVQLGEIGCFGSRRYATLWQGLADDGGLSQLAKLVRNGLDELGFPYDEKGFLPHVTLMRRADVTKGALPTACVATGRIEAVTLFKSVLSSEGPHYTPLHTHTL